MAFEFGSISKLFKGYSSSGIDIILVKDEEMFKQLRLVEFEGPNQIWLIKAKDLDDIRTLNEKDMGAAGWVRKEEKHETRGT